LKIFDYEREKRTSFFRERKKEMEQNKDFLAATSTLNDLLKQQQQQMNDNEEQLSQVCFSFCCFDFFIAIQFEMGCSHTHK
jgi:hypothetical protein